IILAIVVVRLTYSSVTRAIASARQNEAALRASDENARQFEEKLKALHAVAIALLQANSLDELCRRAIELGRTSLGFDRLGLWLIDEGTDTMTGTYGTSVDGQVRQEKGLQTKIADDPMAAETLRNQSLISVWQDAPLYEGWTIVGRGWNAMAVVWDGAK